MYSDLLRACRYSATYAAQPSGEADTGVLMTSSSAAEDQGLETFARAQELQLVPSKSKVSTKILVSSKIVHCSKCAPSC